MITTPEHVVHSMQPSVSWKSSSAISTRSRGTDRERCQRHIDSESKKEKMNYKPWETVTQFLIAFIEYGKKWTMSWFLMAKISKDQWATSGVRIYWRKIKRKSKKLLLGKRIWNHTWKLVVGKPFVKICEARTYVLCHGARWPQ